MRTTKKLKLFGGIIAAAATTSLSFGQPTPSPAPPPRPPKPPQRPVAPTPPKAPTVKFVVRVTKAPGLDVHVDNSSRSRVMTTIPQGTLLDVYDTDSKENWLHVTPKGKPAPKGWVPKNHVTRTR